MSNVTSLMNVTLSVDLGTAFTLTSPNVIITQPDGTIYSNSASISPSSGTSYNFSALFVPPMGGLYQARFQGIVNTQTVNFSTFFYVPWTNVYDKVRKMLGTSLQQMPDSSLDYEYSNTCLWIATYAPAIKPYYQLSPSYQAGYDQGAAMLLASVVRPYIGGKRPSGELTVFKKGTTTVQYSSGAKREFTIEKEWWLRGLEILEANIPEFRFAAMQDRGGDEVMSRGKLARGNFHPLAGWLVMPGGSIGFDIDTLLQWNLLEQSAVWNYAFNSNCGEDIM